MTTIPRAIQIYKQHKDDDRGDDGAHKPKRTQAQHQAHYLQVVNKYSQPKFAGRSTLDAGKRLRRSLFELGQFHNLVERARSSVAWMDTSVNHQTVLTIMNMVTAKFVPFKRFHPLLVRSISTTTTTTTTATLLLPLHKNNYYYTRTTTTNLHSLFRSPPHSVDLVYVTSHRRLLHSDYYYYYRLFLLHTTYYLLLTSYDGGNLDVLQSAKVGGRQLCVPFKNEVGFGECGGNFDSEN